MNMVPLESVPRRQQRAAWFTFLVVVVTMVADGWSGRPVGLGHQLLLLPFTAIFLFSAFALTFAPGVFPSVVWTPHRALQLAVIFEACVIALNFYEVRHFAGFGYRLHAPTAGVLFGSSLAALLWLAWRRRPPAAAVQISAAGVYAAGMLVAIVSYPLNYLRSDMLPVIQWADTSLLRHADPYTTMHVGSRVYDFPYLPGMMLAFFPAAWLHLDPRFAAIGYVVGVALLLYSTAAPADRLSVAAISSTFLLCPFLQYRHELYIQPHWFFVVLGLSLMARRHFLWGALAFGVSMAIYQFSWILFPFLLLNALRRRGWGEVVTMAALAALGGMAPVLPFLTSARHRIASNTVSQWGHLPHALADPINFSYWATFLIRPDKLLRLQAVLMIVLFVGCLLRGACRTLTDTVRWMLVALITFTMFNVLVDGYFFLFVLVVALVYTMLANGWWPSPEELITSAPGQSDSWENTKSSLLVRNSSL